MSVNEENKKEEVKEEAVAPKVEEKKEEAKEEAVAPKAEEKKEEVAAPKAEEKKEEKKGNANQPKSTKPPKPTECAACDKTLIKKLWYYRNGAFYCTKKCFMRTLKGGSSEEK